MREKIAFFNKNFALLSILLKTSANQRTTNEKQAKNK